MKTVVTFVAAGVLVACGASSKRVNGPDGQGEWYSVSCRRSVANCEEEAGNVCPRGYEVMRSDRVTDDRPTPRGLESAGEMLVKCR